MVFLNKLCHIRETRAKPGERGNIWARRGDSNGERMVAHVIVNNNHAYGRMPGMNGNSKAAVWAACAYRVGGDVLGIDVEGWAA